jgi:hypothetical protein
MRPNAREIPNTEACLAGCRRVTQQPGEICVLMDGPSRLPWRTEPLATVWSCSAASFWQIQLMLWLFYYWMYTKHQQELYHARKAWVKTLVRPLPSLWSYVYTFIFPADYRAGKRAESRRGHWVHRGGEYDDRDDGVLLFRNRVGL